MTAELPPLRDVIKRYGLDARKALGQHFLLDSNLTDRIARAAGDLSDVNVIEVGPGPGGLTRSLLATKAARVIAVEKDERCIEALGELAEAYGDRLKIVAADALELKIAELAPPPRRIVANLPYNVGTQLLIGWLRDIVDIDRMVLMFQREVAERIVAPPGGKDYGRLAVISQWLTAPRILFNIDRRAFTPPPKVESSVVEIVPRPAPLAGADWNCLERVTAAAFGQRRKMLRGSLKPLDLDPAEAGIEPTRRAEELNIAEFCALARLLAEKGH